MSPHGSFLGDLDGSAGPSETCDDLLHGESDGKEMLILSIAAADRVGQFLWVAAHHVLEEDSTVSTSSIWLKTETLARTQPVHCIFQATCPETCVSEALQNPAKFLVFS